MSNQLQTNLDAILLDKNTNLKPENLKAGITCLGVEGNLYAATPIYNTVDYTYNNLTVNNRPNQIHIINKFIIIRSGYIHYGYYDGQYVGYVNSRGNTQWGVVFATPDYVIFAEGVSDSGSNESCDLYKLTKTEITNIGQSISIPFGQQYVSDCLLTPNNTLFIRLRSKGYI